MTNTNQHGQIDISYSTNTWVTLANSADECLVKTGYDRTAHRYHKVFVGALNECVHAALPVLNMYYIFWKIFLL